jgi:hypothetical protein
MYFVSERSVAQEERRDSSIGGLTDWDTTRVFLGAVRGDSIRLAVDRLEPSTDAVHGRIDDFQRQTGDLKRVGDSAGLHCAMSATDVSRHQPTSRFISRDRPRSTLNWSGSDECV